jgi:hypothetical protein
LSFLQLSSFQKFCAEHKLDAATLGLEKDGRPVDLSLPFRFCGLQNNCTVELAEKKAGAAGVVRIAIQTASGQRAQSVSSSTATLAELINSFASSGSLQIDVASLEATDYEGAAVVYMRSTVAGEALKTTTLADLGIVGGAVSLRLQLPVAAAAEREGLRPHPTTDTPEDASMLTPGDPPPSIAVKHLPALSGGVTAPAPAALAPAPVGGELGSLSKQAVEPVAAASGADRQHASRATSFAEGNLSQLLPPLENRIASSIAALRQAAFDEDAIVALRVSDLRMSHISSLLCYVCY